MDEIVLVGGSIQGYCLHARVWGLRHSPMKGREILASFTLESSILAFSAASVRRRSAGFL